MRPLVVLLALIFLSVVVSAQLSAPNIEASAEQTKISSEQPSITNEICIDKCVYLGKSYEDCKAACPCIVDCVTKGGETRNCILTCAPFLVLQPTDVKSGIEICVTDCIGAGNLPEICKARCYQEIGELVPTTVVQKTIAAMPVEEKCMVECMNAINDERICEKKCYGQFGQITNDSVVRSEILADFKNCLSPCTTIECKFGCMEKIREYGQTCLDECTKIAESTQCETICRMEKRFVAKTLMPEDAKQVRFEKREDKSILIAKPEAVKIDTTKNEIAIPVKSAEGMEMAQIVARTEKIDTSVVSAEGIEVRAEVMDIKLRTKEQELKVATKTGTVRVRAALEAKLEKLQENGSVDVRVANLADKTKRRNFEFAARKQRMRILDHAGAIEIVKKDLDLANATITFKVDKSWLGSRSADAVRVFREDDAGNVEILSTSVVGEEEGMIVFQALSPGLSTFAVFMVETIAEPEKETKPVELGPLAAVIMVFVIIFAVGITVLVFKKRKK